MDKWILEVAVLGLASARLTISRYGHVQAIHPSPSPLPAYLDIDGFDPPGDPGFTSTDPQVSITEVTSTTGRNVTGMALSGRTSGHGQLRSEAVVQAVIHIPERQTTTVADNVQTESAQAQIDAVAWYQEHTDGARAGDDVLVGLTVFQASKIAAMMTAAKNGFHAYQNSLPNIALFLSALSIEADTDSSVRQSVSAEKLWSRINDLPWPRPGDPVGQPDV